MTTQTRVTRGVPAGGQFAATSHTEPETRLGQPTAAARTSSQEIFNEVFQAQAGDAEIIREFPGSGSDTKRLLQNPRGAMHGRIRQVSIGHGVVPQDREVEVVGPQDGRPIIVDVQSGMIRLKIVSGKAIVRSDSSWGNVVDVADGAEATVIAEGVAKVTMSVESGGSATFYSTRQSHRMHATVEEGGNCQVKLPGEELKPYVDQYNPDVESTVVPTEAVDDDDDKCSCGASLDDGEGWDGKCGDCADVAEVEGCTQAEGCDSPGHVDGCPEEW